MIFKISRYNEISSKLRSVFYVLQIVYLLDMYGIRLLYIFNLNLWKLANSSWLHLTFQRTSISSKFYLGTYTRALPILSKAVVNGEQKLMKSVIDSSKDFPLKISEDFTISSIIIKTRALGSLGTNAKIIMLSPIILVMTSVLDSSKDFKLYIVR